MREILFDRYCASCQVWVSPDLFPRTRDHTTCPPLPNCEIELRDDCFSLVNEEFCEISSFVDFCSACKCEVAFGELYLNLFLVSEHFGEENSAAADAAVLIITYKQACEKPRS